MEISAGKIASVITSLQMLERPANQIVSSPAGCELELVSAPGLDWYRQLFRKVGEPWLWFSRLRMSDEQLSAIITHPDVKVFVVKFHGQEEGILELDFRIAGECELAFFGITEKLIGKGIGKWMMSQATSMAWSAPIKRFWVHTCTLDGPMAVSFYMKAGFVPFQRQIEIADDPRAIGLYPKTTAPQTPLI